MKIRNQRLGRLLAAPTLLILAGAGYALWSPEAQQVDGPAEVLIGSEGFSVDSATLHAVESFELGFGAFAGETSSRELHVQGNGFYGTALGPWVRTADGTELGHLLSPEGELVVLLPDSLSGPQTLEVELSDGRKSTLDVSL